ncbi:PH domain-containing protein [Glaciihabitans sp. INWT7]|uniref:PH domain-containing protein n=1 Tax=Glaciihabitans sp. INWT7 TaxID=2596912 RepID=UPI0016274ECA|nr:PH domain-containing protein [Glaciihabitans sp. INWT7]QNE47548.1 PH domain-containing protein [Glaciihabitans sp. INWT7]
MPQLPGPERETIASRFNRTIAIGVWVISLIIAVSLFFINRPDQLAYLVPLALVNLLVWEALWRPLLVVSDEGVVVTNPFRAVHVPWNALVNIDTKFALTLFTPGRKIEVWVAPSPGRSFGYRSAAVAEREIRRTAPHSTNKVRPGDLPSSESGAAAEVVRSRWELLQVSGQIEAGVADSTRVTTHWHWYSIAAIVALLVSSVPALLIA